MSLTGALLAVFIQQWAQSYLQATQKRRRRPHTRARIRAFHAEGLEKLCLLRVTRTMPIPIHVSLFLFFAGLPIFLFNVNRTVFNVVVTWLAICVAGYACITFMPIFYQNSPYYSPLSSSIWWCVHWYADRHAKSHFHWPSLRAIQKAAGRFARNLPSKFDYDTLLRMFKTLNNEDEFELFFDALPSLCDSKRLHDARTEFIIPNKTRLSRALTGMMDRTLLSELVHEEVKQRRITICTKVVRETSLLKPSDLLRRVLFGDWIEFSRSIYFGLFVQNWKDISDLDTAFYAQCVVAVTLASVQNRDDHWVALASGQVNESKAFIRSYYAEGDNILLVNAIFIIRRAIQTFCGLENRDKKDKSILELSSTLGLVCRFNIQNTSEIHHGLFCGFWNQLVNKARETNTDPYVSPLCVKMLKSIRRLYVALHEIPSKDSILAASTVLPTDRNLNPPPPANSPADGVVRPDPYDNPETYPKCDRFEHQYLGRLLDLPLNELSTGSDNKIPLMARIPGLTSDLVPVLPPIIPTVASNQAHLFHSPGPQPQIPRWSPDERATMPEADSRDPPRVQATPSPPSPLLGPRALSISDPVQVPGPSHFPGEDFVTAPVQRPVENHPAIKLESHGTYSGLLPHSLHSVWYENEEYPTALHLFLARPLLPDQRDHAERIRRCERVKDLAPIIDELREFHFRWWDLDRYPLVSNVFFFRFLTLSRITMSLY